MTLNSLKKIIKYRSNYSGTKETDILYKKYFINNLNSFSENELKLLKSVFDIYSDSLCYQAHYATLGSYQGLSWASWWSLRKFWGFRPL